MDKKIVGAFKTEASAVKAIDRLKKNGYFIEEISVIAGHSDKLGRIEVETGVHTDEVVTGAVTGVVTGAITGGVLGGIGALLVEISLFAIPGVGPILAAGPITATLTGLLAGGAVSVAAGGVIGGSVGGLSGALIGFGLSKAEAKEYENYLNEGNILVLVDERDNRDLVCENFYENSCINKNVLKKKQKQKEKS